MHTRNKSKFQIYWCIFWQLARRFITSRYKNLIINGDIVFRSCNNNQKKSISTKLESLPIHRKTNFYISTNSASLIIYKFCPNLCTNSVVSYTLEDNLYGPIMSPFLNSLSLNFLIIILNLVSGLWTLVSDQKITHKPGENKSRTKLLHWWQTNVKRRCARWRKD